MKIQTLTVSLAALVLSACTGGMRSASQGTPVAGSTPSVPTGLPTTPTGTRGTSTTQWYWTQGGQSLLQLDSNYTLGQYASYTPNSPSNAQVNLFFTSNGSGSYQGYVKIAYQDTDANGNSVFHDEEFDTGNGTNAKYNGWVGGGQTVFKAFTQDAYGGVIVVIDGKDDADLLSGSVWFKNFDFSGCNQVGPAMPGYCAPQAPTGCWNISLGPYQCQDFVANGHIVMSSSLYPSQYTRLGTFAGMAYKNVFH